MTAGAERASVRACELAHHDFREGREQGWKKTKTTLFNLTLGSTSHPSVLPSSVAGHDGKSGSGEGSEAAAAGATFV